MVEGFRVLSELGRGAASSIYLVQNPRNKQVWALKHIVKGEPKDQRFLDQAESEYQVASRLSHPAIRRIQRLIKKKQRLISVRELFLVMELVDGMSLEAMRRPEQVDAVYIFHQVAEGLAYMHERGYVHADMKPNNVIIQTDGNVKIIDFGQSCTNGTVKERIQGTPDYIAPEQVLRRHITPQTDVFNLGATMYWLLTRKHVPTMIPKGKAGISLRTDDGCIPPIELNSQVPPALSSLVMDCIETEPQARPDNMSQILQRLEIATAQVKRQREGNGDGDGDAENSSADSSMAG